MGNIHAAHKKKKPLIAPHNATSNEHAQLAVRTQRRTRQHDAPSGRQPPNANATNAAGPPQMPQASLTQKELPEAQRRQDVTPKKCSGASSTNVGTQESSTQSPAQLKSQRRWSRGLSFHRKKDKADDIQTAVEPKRPLSLRQIAFFRRKNDEVDDLQTAKERRSVSSVRDRLGIGLFRKKDESVDLKTVEESNARSKLRRLITFHKKTSGVMDSSRTARELSSRSWFRRSSRRKNSPSNRVQESIKTAKEHCQSISPRTNSTPHSKSPENLYRQDHEGEEMTQELDTEIGMPIEEFGRGKTQNEIQAWVDRMLDKGVRGLRQEFMLLRFTTKPTADKYQQFTVNAPFGRNRYKDVFCLDESRIVLRNHPGGNDYIHANYVSTPMTPNRFICAQAPKDETVYDFWLMILQEQIDVIVMLGDFIEKEKPKCAHYFPQEENVNLLFSDVKVQCTFKTVLTEFPCKMLRRLLLVTRRGSTLKVTHYHWSAWPDHGVPNADHSPFRLLHMIRSTKRPICVHCSAGIGRTGSIVAIEYILERLKANAGCDDLVDIVRQLRKQRAGIVQTDLQYLYVHRVMLIYFADLKLISESDRISNFIHDYEQLIPPFQ